MDAHSQNYRKILYFNYIVAAVLAINIYIDLSLMMFGNKLVRENILTIDNVKMLTILMGLCSLGLLVLWKKFECESFWQKLFYALTFVYLAGQTFYHGQVFLDQNTIYFAMYPKWLSPIVILFNICFIYLFCNIKKS